MLISNGLVTEGKTKKQTKQNKKPQQQQKKNPTLQNFMRRKVDMKKKKN